MVDDPVYDPGRRRLKLHDLQILRGNEQHWVVAQPLLRPELAVLDTLARGTPAGQTLVACRDARVWQEFDHSMELVRLLMGEPEL